MASSLATSNATVVRTFPPMRGTVATNCAKLKTFAAKTRPKDAQMKMSAATASSAAMKNATTETPPRAMDVPAPASSKKAGCVVETVASPQHVATALSPEMKNVMTETPSPAMDVPETVNSKADGFVMRQIRPANPQAAATASSQGTKP